MIRYDFDHHVCTDCAGKIAHRVMQVLVDPEKPKGDFNLECSACGDTDGPYAGPRDRDENGRHLQ